VGPRLNARTKKKTKLGIFFQWRGHGVWIRKKFSTKGGKQTKGETPFLSKRFQRAAGGGTGVRYESGVPDFKNPFNRSGLPAGKVGV